MYVYANSKEEADRLEQSLKDLGTRQRERGGGVTAEKLNSLLNKWGNSIGAVL